VALALNRSCAVNAPLYPERLLRLDDAGQVALPLATSGIQRYVWESRFGEILIEVIGDRSYVNGQAVETVDPTAPNSS
jgi:hypothetical protein